jgi:hypothetical protein
MKPFDLLGLGGELRLPAVLSKFVKLDGKNSPERSANVSSGSDSEAAFTFDDLRVRLDHVLSLRELRGERGERGERAGSSAVAPANDDVAGAIVVALDALEKRSESPP